MKSLFGSIRGLLNPKENYFSDWFLHAGKIRAALIQLTHTENGFSVHGFEYDENHKEICYWTSDVGRYRESTGAFDYLFTAKETANNHREFHGFTCLKFIGVENPLEYRGYFVDVFERENGKRYYNIEDAHRILGISK